MVYYKSYLFFDDPSTGERRDGYVYAAFPVNDFTRIWIYFKKANRGSRTWAIVEITEDDFKKGPLKHPNSIVVYLDENFREKAILED